MGADCASCISEFEKKNELSHDPFGTAAKSPVPTPQQKTINQNPAPYFNPTPSSTPWKADPIVENIENQENGQAEPEGFQQQEQPKERRKTDINNVITLIRVQALIKGFIQRRRFRIQRHNMIGQSKYFKASEASETLTGVFDQDAPIETRDHIYTTGAVYSGQWKGGMRHGLGKMKWADGASYEGEWQLNTAHGKGKFFHVEGDVYDGKWANNKANGFGIYTNAKGARYEGHWKDDQQHGEGVENWSEGAKYEGEYNLGKKEGTGKYTYADGSTYDGQWTDNKINGFGI